MKIKNLKDSLEFIDEVADLHQEEWAHLNDGETIEERKERMNIYFSDKFIPSMFVASDNGEFIGTSAIVENDLPSRRELSPWLASVYVKKNQRGKGYSKVLVKYIMEQAKQNGITEMYLYTETAEGLYKKLGWKTICNDKYLGNDIIIMKVKL